MGSGSTVEHRELVDKTVCGKLLDHLVAPFPGNRVKLLTRNSANPKCTLLYALLQRVKETGSFEVTFRTLIPGLESERIDVAVVKNHETTRPVRYRRRKISLTHTVSTGEGSTEGQQKSEHTDPFGRLQGEPAEGREALRVKTYSLTQRWSPALAGREGLAFRPHLVAVVDENEGVCRAVEMVENPLRPAALARWLAAKIGKSETALLWVDDANLVGPMSMYFPQLKVSWSAQPPQLTQFLEGLNRQLPPDRGLEQNLAAHFGEEAALRFYGAARNFYAAKPWERFLKDDRLNFRDSARRDWTLVVVGAEGGEIGFSLYSENGGAPLCGVLLHVPTFVSGADLDLVDRAGLVYPRAEYPWIFRDGLKEELSVAWLEELSWLLEAISQLQDSPVKEKSRFLDRAHDPGVVLTDALLVYWGKRTQLAQELAAFLVEFLQDWMLAKHRGQRNYERTFQELHWIGEDYLATVKKRKLWLDYFLGEPKFSGPSLSEKDRQAYLKTWKLVSEFVSRRLNPPVG